MKKRRIETIRRFYIAENQAQYLKSLQQLRNVIVPLSICFVYYLASSKNPRKNRFTHIDEICNAQNFEERNSTN